MIQRIGAMRLQITLRAFWICRIAEGLADTPQREVQSPRIRAQVSRQLEGNRSIVCLDLFALHDTTEHSSKMNISLHVTPVTLNLLGVAQGTHNHP